MKFLVLTFISIIFLFASVSFATEAAKTKIEELFIWKMSDELSLNPVEEKKFTEIVKKLNHKKADLSSDMQSSMQKMHIAKTDRERNKELNKYKKYLYSYNRLSEDEIESMKSLLGIQRLVKYLEIKQDMTNRLKSLLANPETSPKINTTPLPTPKVIEE